MGTNYPGSLDAYSRPSASTPMNASGYEGHTVVDNLYDAVEAIETELGTDPAGGAATVKARLNTMGYSMRSPHWGRSGYYFSTQIGLHNSATPMTANRLHFIPFWCATSVTTSALCVYVGSGVAGNVRLGIYSSTGATTASPDTLIVDAGTADVSTTGMKEVSVSQSLSGDTLYWMAGVLDCAAQLHYCSTGNEPVRSSGTTTAGYAAYMSHTYGALPSSASSLTWGANSNPMIWVKL